MGSNKFTWGIKHILEANSEQLNLALQEQWQNTTEQSRDPGGAALVVLAEISRRSSNELAQSADRIAKWAIILSAIAVVASVIQAIGVIHNW